MIHNFPSATSHAATSEEGQQQQQQQQQQGFFPGWQALIPPFSSSPSDKEDTSSPMRFLNSLFGMTENQQQRASLQRQESGADLQHQNSLGQYTGLYRQSSFGNQTGVQPDGQFGKMNVSSYNAPENGMQQHAHVDGGVGEQNYMKGHGAPSSGSATPTGLRSYTGTPSLMRNLFSWSGFAGSDSGTPAAGGLRSLIAGGGGTPPALSSQAMSAPPSGGVSARQSQGEDARNFEDNVSHQAQVSSPCRNSLLQKLVDVRSAIGGVLQSARSDHRIIYDPAGETAGDAVPSFSSKELSALAGALSPPTAQLHSQQEEQQVPQVLEQSPNVERQNHALREQRKRS